MNRQEKEATVESIRSSFNKANAVLFADYKGVTSNRMNALRHSMRDLDVEFRVVKNNLVCVALKGTKKEEVVNNLTGPVAALFNYGDAAAAAKALRDFSKEVDALELREGFIGDEHISVDQIKELAELPSKEVLLSQLLSVLNGPIRNFVCVLNAVQRDFVGVLQAIADKKSDGGE